MKKYLFLLVSAVVVFFVASQLRIDREHIPTESEIVVDLLENFAFIRPKEVDVLFKEKNADKKRREIILIMVLKTVDEYLPKSSRIEDKASRALEIMRTSLPDYDFGEPVSEKASYFRMLTSDSEWTVSTIETSQGHFSRWKRVTDMFSATSLE